MNKQKINAYLHLLAEIQIANKISLISHKNPDLDTLWSALWMYEIIKNLDKNKEIELICVDKIPKKMKFLKNIELFQTNFDYKTSDLIIFLDSSMPLVTWLEELHPKLFTKSLNTVNIDHHVSNKLYWRQNIVNANFSSCSMILYDFCETLWFKIDSDLANYLLLWIMSDTWWLRHANTTSETLRIVGNLKECWWDINMIYQNFFNKLNISTLRLWWEIITNSFIENNVLNAFVNKSDVESFDCDYDDVNGVVDYLNMAKEAYYTTLLTQKWDFIRWSLRTLRNDIDLSKLAQKFKWWWHKKASWFTLEWQVIVNHWLQIAKKSDF